MTDQDSKTSMPIEKEIRFAVVMYGGVSLAIYINGVAQELSKMVRATARKRKGDGSFGGYVIEKPENTEVIYRAMGELLNARCVVDILSGTSAGGINAIFLAKALANNQPMSQLENLWIEQGNIELLINDKKSVADIKELQPQSPPTSLLNSQRMYYVLLQAFDEMDKSALVSGDTATPLVDELDLYVTATDIRGLWLPVPLADGQAHEYRYRTVFRFYHSTQAAGESTNDFIKENNPFLAFAARSTSSFPFAFEPIKLEDVGAVLKKRPFVRNYDYMELPKKWNRFYKDYNRPPEDSFESHSFGDGGYLDNKPFSYITETLTRRVADTPVDRRLFYIEPAPEQPQVNSRYKLDRPDAVENVMAALVNLPRYETIRDDLLQIKARNDLIERTNNILRQIERSRGSIGQLTSWLMRGSDWTGKYLDQIISEYGLGYAAYHQLRVADMLDDFAAGVSRNIGMEVDGQSFQVLRQIFEEWRRRKYSSNSKDGRRSENDLLFRMDLRWRVRRLNFLLHTIDDIILGLKNFRTDNPDTEPPMEDQEKRTQAREIVEKSGGLWKIPDAQTEQQYQEALSWVKRELNGAYVELRVRGRQLRARGLALLPAESAGKDLKAYVAAIAPVFAIKNKLEEILKDETRLKQTCDDIEKLSLTLASRRAKKTEKSTGFLYQTMSQVSNACRQALAIEDRAGTLPLPSESAPKVPRAVLKNIRDCLSFYYNHFEYFDMLTFPTTYATAIGESDVVDVYRISPDDAKGLINPQKNKRTKLAGTKLGNFGAFFKKEWRQNDILWGRLDGAERIITTLLPDSPKRLELQLRAWLIILKENLAPDNLQRLRQRLGKAWEDFENMEEPSTEQLEILQGQLETYFERDYAVDLDFSREATLNALGRSMQVIGKLLDGLVEQYQGLQTPAIWLARMGQIFMGVMQVAVPGSLPGLFLRHWLKIAYVFELFLIVVGALLGFNNTVMRFGLIAFLVTFSVDLAVRSIGSYIEGSTLFAKVWRGLTKIGATLVILAILILLYLGLVQLGIAELPPVPGFLKWIGS